MRPRLHELLEIVAQYEVWQRRIPGRNCGDVDYDKMRIRIDPRATAREKADTLVHEALHVWYHERELDPPEEQVREEATRITRRLYGEED